jgi:hypothetical protein
VVNAAPLVEIALSTAPTATPVWVDVTPWVRSFEYARGRQHELDAARPGTLRVVLNNSDRRFDPTHAGGPYYGQLKRRRRVRVSAVWEPPSGTTYRLFSGYARGWPLRRRGYGDQWVELLADDGLAVLGTARISADFPEQRTDARVAAVLATVPWQTRTGWVLGTSLLGTDTVLNPVGDQALDAGRGTVQAGALTGAAALAHLQDVERTEDGRLFVARDGTLTFYARDRLQKQGADAVLATFGDSAAGGELPYAEAPDVDYDDAHLWNDVRVTREGGAEQAAEDAASQADHFRKTLTRGVLAPTDGEAASLATSWLRRHKDPAPRIARLALSPYAGASEASLWPILLGAELGGLYLVRHRPRGGGAAFEQKSRLEAIRGAWTAPAGRWVFEWGLSPVDSTVYWVLGVAGRSELSVTTTLGV